MATDNTELTFIRCHSCRSLIPAMSVRCRMCGAELQDDNKAAASASATESKSSQDHATVAPELLADDHSAVDSQQDPIKDFFADNFDDDPVGTEEKVEAKQSKVVSKQSEEDEVDQELEELDRLLDDLSATSAEEETEQELEDPVKAEAVKPAAKAVNPETIIEAKEADFEEAPVSKPERPSRQTASVKQKVNKVVKHSNEGKIFGWFVSYSDAAGESIELREGKFFVTKDRLKPSDLIVEDESISTPHAMITLSSSLGFQIQDLMSEQGLYIKRCDSKKYELIEDIEVVENGDWLRFGNVDYQIVLIPVTE